MFLPSTLNKKENVLQWQDHVNLYPVDVSYDEFKEYNDDTDFNAAHLDNKDLRKNLTKLFYKYIRELLKSQIIILLEILMLIWLVVDKSIQIMNFLGLITHTRKEKKNFN